MKRETCYTSIQAGIASALSGIGQGFCSKFILIAVAMCAIAAPVMADIAWNAGGADNFWTNGLNWVGGEVPVDGDNVQCNGGPKGAAIDTNHTANLNGVSVNMPTSQISMYRGSEGGFRIEDLVGGGTLTCNIFQVQQGGRPAYEVDVPIIANTKVYTRYRLGGVKFFKSITAPVVDLGRGDRVDLFGDINATTEFNVVRDDAATTAYLSPHPVSAAVPTLTTPTVFMDDSSSIFYANGTVVAGTVTVQNGARYNVLRDGALGGALANVTLASIGYLDIQVPQTTLPASINVGAYGVLGGDVTGATYGEAGNVSFVTNAIFAISAGPVPMPAEIGTDVVWLGVVGDGTWTAGNDGVSIYKGLAIGSFWDNLYGETLQSPLSGGDVDILVCSQVAMDGLSIESLDQTGVANLHIRYPVLRKYGFTINGATNANSVTTFNWIGEVSPSSTLVNYNQGSMKVLPSQTYNFSGMGRLQIKPTHVQGALTFSDSTAYQANTDGVFANKATEPNVKLTFNEGSALLIDDAEKSVLKSLDADQIEVNGTPYLVLATANGAYDITAATHTNLVNFMKQSHVCLYENNRNHQYLEGEGIVLGDGKYLMINNVKGPKYLHSAPGYDSKISAVGGAGTTMGIAIDANGLELYIPVDGNGATLLLNSTNAITVVTPSNDRITQVMSSSIKLLGSITNVPEIDVCSPNIYFQAGVSVPADVRLMVMSAGVADLDTAVTVDVVGGNGQVKDTGAFLTFNTVAPGLTKGCGNLTLGAFNMPVGATYEWGVTDPLGAPGPGYDVISGAATFDGAWTLQITDGGFTGTLDGSEIFTIIDGDSAPVDFIEPSFTASGTGYKVSGASVYLDGNDVMLTGVTGVSAASPSGTVFIIR